MSQMSQIRILYRALFRRSANIYVSKLVLLGQIHHLEYWPRLRSRFEIWLGTTLISFHNQD